MPDRSLYTVAIIGPESTGKSTLSEQLAMYYQTLWVPEYAREYLDRIQRPYSLEDVLAIARGQLEMEDRLAKQAKNLLICDTNLIVIQIWLEHKYHQCPEWIKDTIRSRKYDLHFLTYIDIPWEDDPLREHPHLREYLFERYEEMLKAYGIPYHIVKGNPRQRFEQAVCVIDSGLNMANRTEGFHESAH